MMPPDLSPAALARIAPGLTLARLAALSGIDLSRLSALAHGRCRMSQGYASRIKAAMERAGDLAERGELPGPKKPGRPRR